MKIFLILMLTLEFAVTLILLLPDAFMRNSVLKSLIFSVFPLAVTVQMFEYNSRCKWDIYVDSLPLSRSGIVRGTYAFSIVLYAAMLAFGAAVYIIFSALFLHGPNLDNAFTLFCFPLAILMFITGISLPFYYKFGYSIFKVAMLVGVGCAGGIIGGIIVHTLGENAIIGENVGRGNSVLNFIPPEFTLISLAVGAILYLASMLLSGKLYKTVDL